MFEPNLRLLPADRRQLLNKFYRAHRSRMRVPADARCWVIGFADIIGGLCLSRVAEGHWLTGLMVAPSQRNKGLAKRLVTQALTSCNGPVWLLCEPKLRDFYQPLGFDEPTVLPDTLKSRLQRYSRNKTLIALVAQQQRDSHAQ